MPLNIPNSGLPKGIDLTKLASDIKAIEETLGKSSIYTAKMSSDFTMLAKMASGTANPWLTKMREIVDPQREAIERSHYIKLNELYSKGAPPVAQFTAQLGKNVQELYMAESTLRDRIQAKTAKQKDDFIAQVALANQLNDELARSAKLGELSLRLKSAEAVAAYKQYVSQLDLVRSMKGQTEEMVSQAAIFTKLRDVHVWQSSVLKLYESSGGKLLVETAKAYNSALVDINANLGYRTEILKAGLETQQRTGTSIEETVSLMKELTQQAFKTKVEFNETLTISAMLRTSFGLAESSVASLARTASLLRTPFKAVADELTTIVANTRLTASEASSLFANLGRSFQLLGGVRPGVGTRLAGLEGELKARTGVQGEITAMLANMVSTTQGAMLASQAFRVNPERLNTKEGVEDLLKSLTTLVTQQTRGMDLVGRTQILSNISQQLTGGAVSVNTLNALAESMKATNTLSKERIDLEQRWRDQLSGTFTAVSRFVNSLKALLSQVLVPYLPAINAVINTFTKLLDTIMAFKPLALAVQVVVGASLVMALGRLIGVSIAAAASLTSLATSIGLVGAISTASAAGGNLATFGSAAKGIKVSFATKALGMLGVGLKELLFRGFALLLTPALWSVAAVGIASVVVGLAVNKVWELFKNQGEERKRNLWHLGALPPEDPLEAKRQYTKLVMTAAMSGDVNRVRALFDDPNTRQLMLKAKLLGRPGTYPDGEYTGHQIYRPGIDDVNYKRAEASVVAAMATSSFMQAQVTANREVAANLAKQYEIQKAMLEALNAAVDSQVERLKQAKRAEMEAERKFDADLLREYTILPAGY